MRIGITLGDPAGVGPEIILKALAEIPLGDKYIVFGDADVLRNAMRYPDIPSFRINCVSNVDDAVVEEGVINVYDMKNIDISSFRPGIESAEYGKAAYDYIAESIRYAMSGLLDAVCTAPINKVSLHMADVPYIGHTEIFAALTGTDDPLTMFEVGNLRIFFLTRHVSLRKACDMVTYDRLCDYVKRCTKALRQIGIEGKDMAIAGLNPHSGDHGLFGNEETEIVRAVADLRAEGYAVTGPVSADSVFHLALNGRYSSVLSLYHDQGHIAAKTYDFERTISLTLGMPILRTSVDHGTAMDIAGTGKASAIGMIEALKAASHYAPFFRREV